MLAIVIVMIMWAWNIMDGQFVIKKLTMKSIVTAHAHADSQFKTNGVNKKVFNAHNSGLVFGSQPEFGFRVNSIHKKYP